MRHATLVIGIVVFSVLMGVRSEFPSMWQRVLIAMGAGFALALGIVDFRAQKKQGKVE